MKNPTIKSLVYISLVGCMAYILARFTKFPVFPVGAPFLKMDFGEIPLLLLMTASPSFIGIYALLVKELLSFFVSGSNIFGLIADFVAVASFLVVFKLVLKEEAGIKRIVIALIIGAAVRMVIAVPLNLVILKLQFGTPAAGVFAQLSYIIPFNFLKCVLDVVCFIFLYPRVKGVIKV